MIPFGETVIIIIVNTLAAGGRAVRRWLQRRFKRWLRKRSGDTLPEATNSPATDPEDGILLGTVVPWPTVHSTGVAQHQEEGDESEDEEDDEHVAASTGTEATARVPGDQIVLPFPLTFLHLLATGSTGSGKSTFLRNVWVRLIQHICTTPGVLLVVDPFGDALPAILNFLAGPDKPAGIEGVKVIVLDFAAAVLLCWNPLRGPGDAFTRASRILDLVRSWHTDGLGVTVEELLRNTLVCLAEIGENLAAIEPFLSDPDYRGTIVARVTDSSVRAYFRRFDAQSPDRQEATIAATLNKLTSLLAHPRLRACFSDPAPAFDLAEIINGREPVIFLASFAAESLPGRVGFLVSSLFLSSIESLIIARTAVEAGDRLPLYLLIDEFGALVAGSSQFTTLITQGRRLKCGLILAAQNYSLLPQSLLPTLINNVGTRLAFATGAVDAAPIAQGVVCELSKEQVRATVVGLPIGTGIVTMRGQRSVLVKVPFRPEPQADPTSVAALREATVRQFAPSTASDDAKPTFLRRATPGGDATAAGQPRPADPAATPANTDKTPEGGETPPTPYEIREVKPHGKKPRGAARRNRGNGDAGA